MRHTPSMRIRVRQRRYRPSSSRLRRSAQGPPMALRPESEPASRSCRSRRTSTAPRPRTMIETSGCGCTG